MTYAGIGSRETPDEWLKVFEELGEELADKFDALLRSGHADGADYAFEVGCNKVMGKKEIFLPWKGFNSSQSELYEIPLSAFEMAEVFTPYWSNCSQGAQKLKARNCQQILGKSLNDPVSCVICYTENGKIKGGTGLALQIARQYDIPIFNAGSAISAYAFEEQIFSFFENKLNRR